MSFTTDRNYKWGKHPIVKDDKCCSTSLAGLELKKNIVDNHTNLVEFKQNIITKEFAKIDSEHDVPLMHRLLSDIIALDPSQALKCINELLDINERSALTIINYLPDVNVSLLADALCCPDMSNAAELQKKLAHLATVDVLSTKRIGRTPIDIAILCATMAISIKPIKYILYSPAALKLSLALLQESALKPIEVQLTLCYKNRESYISKNDRTSSGAKKAEKQYVSISEVIQDIKHAMSRLQQAIERGNSYFTMNPI